MKLNLLFIIAILFANSSTFGQIQVIGKVTGPDGESLLGATVALSNSMVSKGDNTDADGNFSISLETKGTYDLEIRFIGFVVYQKSLAIEADYDLGTIRLEEDNLELQTVEIVGRVRTDYNSDYSFSASKIAIKNRELPQAISTITKELLSDRQAFQLVDAVRTVSNVAPTGIYNHYNIRGITQGDDGQMVNGLRTRQYYFLQPITSHLERVEVIKGPSSVTFSSADPGGTVNMVTKKPLKEKRGAVSMSTGSFGTLRSTIDLTGPLNEEKTLLYRLNAAYQEAKSFRDVVNNNAFLITPSLSYVPNESTALKCRNDLQQQCREPRPWAANFWCH